MSTGTKISRYLLIALVLTLVVFCASSIFGGFTLVSAGIYRAIARATPSIAVAMEVHQETEATDMEPIQTIEVIEESPTETLVPPSLTASPLIEIQPEPSGTPELEPATEAPEAPTAIPSSTATEIIQPTQTSEPTSTPAPTQTPTITLIPPTLDATSMAMPMYANIENLFDQKVISTTDGKFYVIDDFENNWADTTTYQKTYTGYDPTDFVLRADLTWQVAAPNLGMDSGCGIVYHENEEENHYLVVFTLGDRAIVYRRLEGSLINLGASYRYDVDSELAQAEIMLVVEDNHLRVFVDGKELYDKKFPSLETGKLAFTVISGSSVDYGTRCEMRNIELWEIMK